MRSSALALFASLAVAAAAARAGEPPAPFTEEAFARGISFNLGIHVFPTFGVGLAFADLDGDGDGDLVAAGRPSGVIGFFENDGTGHFEDLTASGGPIIVEEDPSGVCAADYDGDGDLDVYLSNWLKPNHLLRNDGGFSFTSVGVALGVNDQGAGTGCAWGDYDLDGWLDLYVSNRTLTDGSTIPNRLYRSLAGAGFVDVAGPLGVDDDLSLTFQATFFDYDLDGDGDLHLSTDKGYALGEENRLFRNDGGVFVDVSGASGTDISIDSMGVACGDFDNDGFLDLYCTNTQPGNVLLMNQGDGTFADESAAAQVACNGIGWGTMFVDYDHDGFQELFVCNSNAPDRFYDADGVWPAVDLGPALGVAHPGASWCVAAADIDLDGDPDLIVQCLDRLRLYVNHEGEKRNAVRFDVRGPWPNRFAVGAVVAVSAGGAVQLREVAAGRHYKTQDEMTLHVGLGAAAMIDEVTVTWPAGVARTIANLPANATWTLYHPDLLFDGDQDGDVEIDDFMHFAQCAGAGGSSPLQAGCEMMDGEGDGDVDLLDLDLFLGAYAGAINDCDGNGVSDLEDIVAGTATDTNGNAIPDACEMAGDVNGDGAVNVSDLVLVIVGFGPCPPPPAPCPGDATFDGTVDVSDLVAVILGWGP